MSNVWFTSDLHFGHEKIIQYEAEHHPFTLIEEHDEAIIANINSCVRPGALPAALPYQRQKVLGTRQPRQILRE